MVEHQSRREQILLTAYEIVGRNGIEGLHARTVAADLKINHAAVHYYFRTRDDLLTALIQYAHSRFVQDHERVCSPQPTAGKRLEAHIALFEAYCKPQSRFFRVMASLFVASIGNEKLQPGIRALNEHQSRLLAQDIEAAKNEGAILIGTEFANSESLACYLIGMCFRMQVSGGGNPKTAIDRLLAMMLRK